MLDSTEAGGTAETATEATKDTPSEFVSRIRPPSRLGDQKIKERTRSAVAESSTGRKPKTPEKNLKRGQDRSLPLKGTCTGRPPSPPPRLITVTKTTAVTRANRTPPKPRAREPGVTVGAGTRASVNGSRANHSRSSLENSGSIGNLSHLSNDTDAPVPKPKLIKRSAWDTKGRLEDSEKVIRYLKYELKQHHQAIQEITGNLTESQRRIDALEASKQSLKDRADAKARENEGNLDRIEQLKGELEACHVNHAGKVQQLQTRHELALKSFEGRVDILNREKELLTKELRDVTTALERERVDCQRLTQTLTEQTASYSKMLGEKGALDACLKKAHEDIGARDRHIHTLTEQLAQSRETVASLETRIREEETVRRQLHNTIQELKGNIRVFCRVRPPIGAEKDIPGTLTHLAFPDQESDAKLIELKQVKESSLSKAIHKTHPFTFDKVFLPTSTQEEVFSEISQLVQSALDGYPVCIFAYGQTGSGKTFTMEGPTVSDPSSEGMIPRAVTQIFESAEKLKAKGWRYQLVCQFVEIYNEALHDLLGSGDSKKHEIKHDPVGKTTVTEVVTREVRSPREVHSLLARASSNRAVASTNCNERSSRSHSVFTMRLSGRNGLTAETSEGVLNLIDLAGSESLTKSGSAGERLKETQAINRSLSCLSDVIYALSSQSPHIPYRNSKLTYLLQNSLGGNSKTLMFVNVSPLVENSQETLFSLQFATKVNACHIGTARKNPR
ncbi:kinesin-like nuclear fusion protein [Massospora cicadina]|nr:kinesin-like nuclear fusion protein [Massospora cicadina]